MMVSKFFQHVTMDAMINVVASLLIVYSLIVVAVGTYYLGIRYILALTREPSSI